MIEKYRITFNQQVTSLKGLFIVFMGYLLIMGYSIYESNFGGDLVIALIFCFLLLAFFPVILVHLDYYLHNNDMLLEIDRENEKLLVIKNDKVSEYKFGEIVSIVEHKSRPFARNDIQYLPTDSYHYTKITTENGEYLIITSLLAPNFYLGKKLADRTKLKKRIIASIWYDEYLNENENRELELVSFFSNKLKNKTNKELKKIISSPENYQEPYVIAAEKELSKREA